MGFEALAPKRVGECRKPAAFRVREPEPAAIELGFEDTVFREKVRDDLLLVTLKPPSNHGNQDVENHGVPRVKSRDAIIRSNIHPT
jgi:hypothetical protein